MALKVLILDLKVDFIRFISIIKVKFILTNIIGEVIKTP